MAGESRKLAGEGKQPALGSVVQRLLAKPVAGQEQAAAAAVVDRESEHAVEFERQFLAPFLPAMDQDLGIGMMRGEFVSAAHELPAELRMIVEFAVEHDADLAVLVPHRLVAACDIDDRQSPMPEEDMPDLVDIKTVAIRPAMRQRGGHALRVGATAAT